jgi:methylenetetrahydrofolate reductase (NADPH)
MSSVRLWSVRHAGALERLYRLFMHVAPRLRRGVAWLGPERLERVVAPAERTIKGLFFDCHMCGRCTLSSTGMACTMNCPKRHRNGTCGGVAADGGCEVDPDMRCVWLEALDGAKRIAGEPDSKPAQIQRPADRRLRGSSVWISAIMARDTAPPESQSGAAPATARGSEPGTLEHACRSGRFVVTAELSPPDSADPQDLLRRAAPFRDLVDAVNVTDGAGGNCHMSSLAASALLAADGYEPVFQIACRDRNRIAMQGDMLGAAALGVRNLLAVTGDGVGNGDHPEARAVFDVDSVSLLELARGLRDRGRYASGRSVSARPGLFLGATVNPFAPPFGERIANFEKKIAAGAQFVQTQYCFDPEMLDAFMQEVRARGIERRCHILVGVGPLPSARAARWMVAHVPGVHIPEQLLHRLERSTDQKREGAKICVELIRALRRIEGIAGVHVMAHRTESLVPEILSESGLAGERTAAPGRRNMNGVLLGTGS